MGLWLWFKMASGIPSSPADAAITRAGPSILMAFACLGGGVAGMLVTGSARQLVSGCLLAGAFSWSSRCFFADQDLRGYRLATATSLLLVGSMGHRFYRMGGIKNAGMLLCGAASAAHHGLKWSEMA